MIGSFYCRELINCFVCIWKGVRIYRLRTEVTLSDKSTVVIGSVYRHPQPIYHKFSQVSTNNLLKLKPLKIFVVLGDFNINCNR